MKTSSSADLVRIKHIIDATKEALGFVEEKTRADLDSDRMLVLALLKELELIGEAASKISLSFRETHKQIPWTLLIATRNRLIHGYFDINLDIVWKTIDQDLRGLLRIIEHLGE
jgi:uncharacterized protein with HEPN domain